MNIIYYGVTYKAWILVIQWVILVYARVLEWLQMQCSNLENERLQFYKGINISAWYCNRLKKNHGILRSLSNPIIYISIRV